jgi:F-type H+-transporting ATPase subunit b
MLKRMMLAIALATWVFVPAARAQHEEHSTAAAARESEAANRLDHGSEHVAAGASAEHAEHAEKPLIDDTSDPQTWYAALWVVIIFVVLLAVLYPTAWKGVLAGLKAREERIRKDIADAEAARGKAEATLREYNSQLATAEGRVRDMIAKATGEAERIAASIRAHAQQESEEIKERANRDIETAKNQALSEIYEQTANLATNVAEKILRRNLNADDQRDLVKSSLDQLQTIR